MSTGIWMQHAFVVSLIVLVPLGEIAYDRKLKAFTNPARRIAWYRANILLGVAFAATAIALGAPRNLFIMPGGQASAAWLSGTAVYWGAVLLVAAFTALTLAQSLRAIANPAWRARISPAMRPLRFMLPVSARECTWWLFVSLSAGVCEEIVYRGFVTHYLSGSLASGVSLGGVGAWLACSLVFGAGHAYQGVSGLIRTTLSGLMLGLVAALTGSLALPIVLHVLFDAQVLCLYRPLRDDPEGAAQLMRGCAAI